MNDMNNMIGKYIQVREGVQAVYPKTLLAGLVGYVTTVDNSTGNLIVYFPTLFPTLTVGVPIILYEIYGDYATNQTELSLAYQAEESAQGQSKSKPQDNFDLLYQIIDEKRDIVADRLSGYKEGSQDWKKAKAAYSVLEAVLVEYSHRIENT